MLLLFLVKYCTSALKTVYVHVVYGYARILDENKLTELVIDKMWTQQTYLPWGVIIACILLT